MDQEASPSQQRYRLPAMALVGIVVGSWGIAGGVRVQAHTDNPHRFSPGSQLWVGGQALRVERCRRRRGYVLVKLQGIDTPEDARRLQGARLEVPLEEVPPASPDSYYHFQILDMEVWSCAGEYLGRVTEILDTGSNDVYVVRGERGEVLVPALKNVVVEVDTERGRMTVELPEGLR